MIRLIGYVLFSLALTLGITWLLSIPGVLTLDVAGYRLQPRIGVAVIALLGLVGLSILSWNLFSGLLSMPSWLQSRAARRRQQQGILALSEAFVALEAGNPGKARNLARDAGARLPGNAAAKLLEARAELALGRWGEARDQYRELLDDPETAVAALSGLYEQAKAQNRPDAALTFARKAHSLSPELSWAGKVIFRELTRNEDWPAALKMVHREPARSREARAARKRKLAVLHTAIAGANETTDPNTALDNARIALKMEPDFVPAALIAARIHSNKGELRKAGSLLRRVWRNTHHPHVAELFANVQPGISPLERLKRLKDLMPDPPPDAPNAIVLAQGAIAAADFSTARKVLAPYAKDAPTRAVCVAMARITEGENADHGRARQWLSRAISAPPDPTWTADGVTADEWAPVSPVTGELDAFEFKVPTSSLATPATPGASDPVGQEPPRDLILDQAARSPDAPGPDVSDAAESTSPAHSTQNDVSLQHQKKETGERIETTPQGADT